MSIGGFVAVSGLAIATASLAMAVVIVALKVHRSLRARVWERRVEPYRRRVVLVAAGEDTEDGDTLAELAGLTRGTRSDVDELVLRLLGKVRGEPATELVELLRRHGALERSARELRSRSSLRRARALHLIGRCRDWTHADAAIEALEDRSPRVRAQAARTVGQIGDPRAARPLLEALRLEGVHAGDAAEALAGLGHGATDALLWALHEGSPRARTVAAHLAGTGGGPAAAPLPVHLPERKPPPTGPGPAPPAGAGGDRPAAPLAADLAGRNPDPAVAATAVTALGLVGRSSDIGAIAGATVRYHPPQLRRAAAEALGELGDPLGVAVLVRLLADRESQVSEAAARSLLALGPAGRAALALNAHLPTAGAALAQARLTGVAV
ncbi:HEAT repeat domain-containing protein [Phycicoccus sp.]|uniref:HEAT repeat domain-containing protein n=1 Tax=Phycicoccus sp. TaxID=1902410 RepID=UPI002B7A08F7|nr:HEAT repeat domain-containing protein [Phycicoccus sp.]HMM94695.1 HEAT repeat domain-containing protein [Phycicoccus sp.]